MRGRNRVPRLQQRITDDFIRIQQIADKAVGDAPAAIAVFIAQRGECPFVAVLQQQDDLLVLHAILSFH